MSTTEAILTRAHRAAAQAAGAMSLALTRRRLPRGGVERWVRELREAAGELEKLSEDRRAK